MTKKEALKATYEIWNKLADLEDKTGNVQDQHVKDELGWKYVHSCPCCQYVFDLDDNVSTCMAYHDCDKCPMISFWEYGCEGYRGITSDITVYNSWIDGEFGCARKIANTALELHNKE